MAWTIGPTENDSILYDIGGKLLLYTVGALAIWFLMFPDKHHR